MSCLQSHDLKPMVFYWAAAASQTPVNALYTEMNCRETGNETDEDTGWHACSSEAPHIPSHTAVQTKETTALHDALPEHKKLTRVYSINDCKLSASGNKEAKYLEHSRVSAFKLLFYSSLPRRSRLFKSTSTTPYVEWVAALESYARSNSLIVCPF